MKSTHETIRKTLRDHADGLTASEIEDKTGINADTIRKALKNMPDCYIDRWTASSQGNLGAIWIAVNVPEDCPMPSKSKVKVTKNYLSAMAYLD